MSYSWSRGLKSPLFASVNCWSKSPATSQLVTDKLASINRQGLEFPEEATSAGESRFETRAQVPAVVVRNWSRIRVATQESHYSLYVESLPITDVVYTIYFDILSAFLTS